MIPMLELSLSDNARELRLDVTGWPSGLRGRLQASISRRTGFGACAMRLSAANELTRGDVV
jgi:hypothetical protein